MLVRGVRLFGGAMVALVLVSGCSSSATERVAPDQGDPVGDAVTFDDLADHCDASQEPLPEHPMGWPDRFGDSMWAELSATAAAELTTGVVATTEATDLVTGQSIVLELDPTRVALNNLTKLAIAAEADRTATVFVQVAPLPQEFLDIAIVRDDGTLGLYRACSSLDADAVAFADFASWYRSHNPDLGSSTDAELLRHVLSIPRPRTDLNNAYFEHLDTLDEAGP